MEFPTIDKFAKDVAEKALDEFIYEGKTIREWVELLAKQQPCEDAISRQAAIDAIYKKYIGGKDAIKNASNDYADGLAEAVDAVWDMPSVTPTRPTGKWKKYLDEGGFLYCECSNCGLITNEPDNYCPNCGARCRARIIESEE